MAECRHCRKPAMPHETARPGTSRVLLAGLAGALVALSCATSPRGAPFVPTIDPTAPPELRECMEKPAVRGYYESLHRSIVDAWHPPRGIAADQDVRIRLRVDADGELLEAELVSSTSPGLEASALEAVHDAAPFAPVPGPARCITQYPLVARFQNPERPGTAASSQRAAGDSYIELAAYRGRFNNTYLMHWPVRKMPLAVHLPPPPEGLFEEPDAVFDAVRRAVLEWTDVASPGVPSFRFVDRHGDADIPIVWAAEPSGDWYIAFCSMYVRPRSNLFDVEQILVTGRWRDGHVASPEAIHGVALHEMGHALGIHGHSDDPRDVMYARPRQEGARLSDRDRNTLRELYSRGNRQIRGRRGRPR